MKKIRTKKITAFFIMFSLALSFFVCDVSADNSYYITESFKDSLSKYTETQTGFIKTYSGGASLTLQNDSIMGSNTYNIDNNILKVTPGIRTSVLSDASLTLDTGNGNEFTGKVDVSFSMRWAENTAFNVNAYLDPMPFVKVVDNDGNSKNLMGVDGTFAYFGEDINAVRCIHKDCTETHNHYVKNYTMNMVNNPRGVDAPYHYKLCLDFNKATVTVQTRMPDGTWEDFYGSGATEETIEHPVTWGLGNLKNFRKVVFNFPKGIGNNELAPYIEFGDIDVRQAVCPEMSINVKNGEKAVPVNAGLRLMFGGSVSENAMSSVKLYDENNNEVAVNRYSTYDGSEWTVKPKENLKPLKAYTLVVPENTIERSGRWQGSLVKGTSVRFFTAPDTGMYLEEDFNKYEYDPTRLDDSDILAGLRNSFSSTSRVTRLDGATYLGTAPNKTTGWKTTKDGSMFGGISDGEVFYNTIYFPNVSNGTLNISFDLKVPGKLDSNTTDWIKIMPNDASFDGAQTGMFMLCQRSGNLYFIDRTTLDSQWYFWSKYKVGSTSFGKGNYHFEISVNMQTDKAVCTVTKDGAYFGSVTTSANSNYSDFSMGRLRITMYPEMNNVTETVNGVQTKRQEYIFDNIIIKNTVQAGVQLKSDTENFKVNDYAVLEFDTLMSNIAENAVILREVSSGNTVSCTSRLGEDGFSLEVTPAQTLNYNSDYEVLFHGTVTDSNGENVSFQGLFFHTEPSPASFSLGDCAVTDASGNPVQTLTAGQMLKVTAEVLNNGGLKGNDIHLLAVLFDKDGAMVRACGVEKKVEAGKAEAIDAKFNVPMDISEGAYISVFVWSKDSLDNPIDEITFFK